MSEKTWDIGDKVIFEYFDGKPGKGTIEEIQVSVPIYNVRTSDGYCVSLYDHEMEEDLDRSKTSSINMTERYDHMRKRFVDFAKRNVH